MKLAVILHDIRSVHNVGSIFRTADAAGASKIFCCGITPTPLDRFKKIREDFAKVSLGAENYVEWEGIRGKSPEATLEAIKRLKDEGWKIFALEQSTKSIPYYDALGSMRSETDSIALVVGNEVQGLPEGVLQHADKIIEIPMRGKKESLNASVAFGIAIFALRDGRV